MLLAKHKPVNTKFRDSKNASVNKYRICQSNKIRFFCFDSNEENNAALCFLTARLIGHVSL